MYQQTTFRTKALYLAAIVIVFFFPTSVEGEILQSSTYLYFYYGICLILAIAYVGNRYVSKYSVLANIIVLIYLFIASFVSSHILGGSISISRVLCVLLPLILFSGEKLKVVSFRMALFINELLMAIIIVWNIGLILGISQIQNITVNYYSQFNWFTTKSFVDLHSPIFTFGIYSYSAFFYALMFSFWIFVIIRNRERKNSILEFRYYLYAAILIVFQIMMRGSTALMLGTVMLILFLRCVGSSRWRYLAVPVFFLLGAYFIYAQDYDWNRMIIGSSTNGFAVRYMSLWFMDNIQAVKDTILGIGFTVPEKYNLVYSDSGYVVLFTMGNLILPIFLYSRLCACLKKNMPNEILVFSLIVFMLFEIALPGILYPKEMMFIIFYFISVQSVDFSNDSYISEG